MGPFQVHLHRPQLPVSPSPSVGKSVAAGGLPFLGEATDTGGSSDSDVGLLCPRSSVAPHHGVCEPPVSELPGRPTHVILAVDHIWGVPRKEAEAAAVAPPGRRGLDHFLDAGQLSCTTATVAAIRSNQEPRVAPSGRRCVRPRVLLQLPGDPGGRDEAGCEAIWPELPGEVRVRLRPNEETIRAAFLVGSEVLGVTLPLDLRGTARRFFTAHELYRPGHTGGSVAQPLGMVRLALELWPPGSGFSHDFGTSVGPADQMGEGCPQARQGGASLSVASRYTLLCGFCDGVGRKRCQSCRGHGTLICKACDGMLPMPCAECCGTGTVRQTLEMIEGCGSPAAATLEHRCRSCWGSGTAGECCSCFGLGTFRCGQCSGVGWVPCLRCVPQGSAL